MSDNEHGSERAWALYPYSEECRAAYDRGVEEQKILALEGLWWMRAAGREWTIAEVRRRRGYTEPRLDVWSIVEGREGFMGEYAELERKGIEWGPRVPDEPGDGP